MVVFTDLDGTLLDRDTYSHAQAEPALAHLRQLEIPLVLVTSKCRAEVELLRRSMGHRDPYIIENGAAVILPGAGDLVLGRPGAEAREALRLAAAEAGVRVRGFSEMPAAEISERSGLSPEIAQLARRREYGEPFVVLEGDVAEMKDSLERRGFQLTQGGRFFHVLGGYDKAMAVKAVIDLLGDEDTVGLGDAPNDLGFLAIVRRPVIIPSPHLSAMRAALPFAPVAPEPGPAGWNRAVLDLSLTVTREAPRSGVEN